MYRRPPSLRIFAEGGGTSVHRLYPEQEECLRKLIFKISPRHRTHTAATGAANIAGLNSHFLFKKGENYSRPVNIHQLKENMQRQGKKCLCLLCRENSYPGVFCDLFTNHDTGNYLGHGILLQPIRGCPQHSGETAIHRRPLSRFFPEGGGDVCTQANPIKAFNGTCVRLTSITFPVIGRAC